MNVFLSVIKIKDILDYTYLKIKYLGVVAGMMSTVEYKFAANTITRTRTADKAQIYFHNQYDAVTTM